MRHSEQHRERRDSTGRVHAHARLRWRIGNAIVSAEELQSWQLGPLLDSRHARTDTSRPRRG